MTPADSATSEEEQAKLDAQLQQQLAEFRRSAGLDVDPETEASCQELTSEGEPTPAVSRLWQFCCSLCDGCTSVRFCR